MLIAIRVTLALERSIYISHFVAFTSVKVAARYNSLRYLASWETTTFRGYPPQPHAFDELVTRFKYATDEFIAYNNTVC